MDTLADLLARARDREGDAVASPDRATAYSYREFSTNAWKAGNLLSHYGVRSGATVALVVGPKAPGPNDRPGRLGAAADPLLGLLGSVVLGAAVDPLPEVPVEAPAIVLPAAWLDRYETLPGCSRLAYGGPPDTPGVAHFERELWSENPVRPPESVAPDDAALAIGDGDHTHTHAELVAAGRQFARAHDLGAGDRVGLRAPLTSAGAIAAGIVAPLSVGATIVPGAPEGAVYTVGSADGDDRDHEGDGGTVDPDSVI